MDRLLAMQTFVQVAELGSFSQAARALDLPNATVSTRVAQLEAHLQVKLLARTTRRVSLTDDGAAYLQGARRLLQELGELETRLAGTAHQPRGRLRVDVPAAAGRHVLARALPEFLARHPGITLELGSTDRPVDLIGEGVDCVIRAGLVHDDQLVARPLGELAVITCAAPAYLARHGTPATPDELPEHGGREGADAPGGPLPANAAAGRLAANTPAAADAPPGHHAVNFFSAKTGRAFPFEFEREGRRLERLLPHRVATNDADTYQALALAGLGLAQIPLTRRLAEHLDAGRLLPVLADWNAGSLPMFVMYPRHRHLSARVRAFVDWTVALYGRENSKLASGGVG